MRADRRDPVIAEIKKYRATNLVVHMRSGDPRQVPVPTKANRWELLSETLEKLDWVQIECFDRAGALLGIVEGEADDVDGDEGETRDERMARLIANVVHQSMEATRAQYREQMAAFVELASATTQGLRAVQETYSTALRVQAASMATQQQDGGDMDVLKLLSMAAAMQKPAAPQLPVRRPVPVMRRPSPAPTPQKSSSEDAGAANGTPVKQAS